MINEVSGPRQKTKPETVKEKEKKGEKYDSEVAILRIFMTHNKILSNFFENKINAFFSYLSILLIKKFNKN